jgi:hypothetical protein
MTLSNRLSRMEETIPPAQKIEIEAADDNEADDKLTDAILACFPGPLSIAVTVDGVRSEWCGVLPSHDEWVQQCQ